MFTANNYLLVKSEKYGEEYKKVFFKDLKQTDSVIAAQLPECTTTFPVEIDEIEKSDAKNQLVYKLHIVNPQGAKYVVEVPSTTMEAFCRFSKFKQITNIITWYQNFALVDWLGYPCKIERVEETLYDGKLYNMKVKDTNNFIVSGIIFRSKGEEDSEDNAYDDIFDEEIV